MQKKVNEPNWIQKVTLFVTVALLIVASSGAYYFSTNKYSEDEVSTKIEDAVKNAVATANAESSMIINNLTEQLNTIEVEQVTDASGNIIGYLIDGLYIDDSLDETLSDREIALFDGDVEFDGDEYGAEETLVLNGLTLTSNEEDFGSNVYAVAEEGDIKYMFELDSDLNTSLIGVDEEYLTLSLLGQEVEISEWDGDEITFRYGSEVTVDEGASTEFNGAIVTVSFVTEDTAYVEVSGEGMKIDEGETATFGDIEVYVDEILYSSKDSRTSKVVLRIGDEVEESVSDGEEYEEDSIWEWEISSSSIGLVLSEEFKYLDEDFKPLSYDESICLPNEYVCVQFGGLMDSEYRDYKFDKRSNGDVKITGEFVVGHDDVSTIIAKADGTLYNDDDDEVITETVEFEDSDLTLEYASDTLYVMLGSDVQVELDFNVTSVSVDGNSVNQEEDYISNFGVVIKDTEDLDEDNTLELSVPEEEVEGFFNIV